MDQAANSPIRSREMGERIAKAIARAGACSRRDAEEWILAGRVVVNGRKLASPAFNVGPDDKILIDGKPLAERERTRLFLFHKPRGLVTTNDDPEGRSTIFNYLDSHHNELPRLMSVGRLDINTEGLLLLTNDGGLARVLELPSTGWLRRYRVRAHGVCDQAALDALAKGIRVDGIDYAPIEAVLERQQGANVWLTLSLREGKNREVRRVLGELGLEVNRLIRVSYGPFQLGELAEGAVEEIRTKVLRDQLGPSLIAASQADFTVPTERAPSTRAGSTGSGRTPHDRSSREGRPSRERQNFHSAGVAAQEAAPIREKPIAGPRKHISALRAQRKARMEEGPRVKIERAATQDRRGREVKVERVVTAAPKKDFGSRNGRRFAAERDGERKSPPARRRENDGATGPRKNFTQGYGERDGERNERPPRRLREEGSVTGSRKNFTQSYGERNERPARAPREKGHFSKAGAPKNRGGNFAAKGPPGGGKRGGPRKPTR